MWSCKKDDAPVKERASSWLLLQKLCYTKLQTFLILFLFCAILCHSVMSNILQPHGLQPAWLLCPWGFSRQEYWSWLPCPPPGDLPNPGIEPRSPASQADSLPVGLFSTKSKKKKKVTQGIENERGEVHKLIKECLLLCGKSLR